MKLLKIETFNETSEVEGEVITVTRYLAFVYGLLWKSNIFEKIF